MVLQFQYTDCVQQVVVNHKCIQQCESVDAAILTFAALASGLSRPLNFEFRAEPVN